MDNSQENDDMEMGNDDNMDNMGEVELDDEGNPIKKEDEEPEDPIPESTNPLKFTDIRKYLSNLTKTFSGMSYAFTTFNCSEKELDDMCDEIGQFVHLRDVNISKNKFAILKGFNRMIHMFRFDGRENDIRDMQIFSEPNRFKFIQLLYLSQNKIKVLPALDMDNLLELHLDNNNIKKAEGFTQGLKKVKLINLSNNKLKDCVGLSNCPCLEQLKINDNEIKSFKGLENMPKLTNLELANNKFEKFEIIPTLNNLTKINISGNGIAEIKEFGKLKFPNISDITNNGNPAESTKIEMLILFEGFDLKTVNEEEVVPEDIKEAMDQKAERARLAEEERLRKEQEEKEEQERLEVIFLLIFGILLMLKIYFLIFLIQIIQIYHLNFF